MFVETQMRFNLNKSTATVYFYEYVLCRKCISNFV